MLKLAISPPFEEYFGGARRYYYYGLAIAAIVACIYCFLVVTIDNTNLGTTNGLWKSRAVSAWEHGTSTPVEGGGFLYLPVYGTLARMIPDSVVQYGTGASLVTFRKMALINGFLGGIASGLVFFLTTRFTRSLWVAGLVVMAHAGAGFIMLNSINSEDIIPAYTFFVAAVVLFFEFLRSGGFGHYLASALFLALATLFHWTLMAPALAAFGAVFAVLAIGKRTYLAAGALWLFAYLCFLQLLILLCLPRMHIPVWAVLYPGKGISEGWVGFDAGKLVYLCVGIGNYFSGAANVVAYRAAFQGVELKMMIVSWLYCLLTLGACVLTLCAKGASFGLKCLAVFGLVLFATGEFGAVYSQPQDPQMQIQPMFASILGLILLARRLYGNGALGRQLLLGSLTALMAINGLWNVHLFRAQAGGDSLALRQIHELNALFPKDSTVTVSQGFAGWVTWQSAVLWADDDSGFQAHSVLLTAPFIANRGIGGANAAALTIRRIDGAMASGLRVAATDLWTQTPGEFASSVTTVTTLEQARIYDSVMRSHYRIGMTWATSVGPFVELLPQEQSAK